MGPRFESWRGYRNLRLTAAPTLWVGTSRSRMSVARSERPARNRQLTLRSRRRTRTGHTSDSYRTDDRLRDVIAQTLRFMTENNPTGNVRLADVIEAYRLASESESQAMGTLAMKRWVLDGCRDFLVVELGHDSTLYDFSLKNTRAYIADLGKRRRYEKHPNQTPNGRLSTSTIAQNVRVLRAFAKWLVDDAYAEKHCLQNLKAPRITSREIHPLSQEEMRTLFGIVRGGDFHSHRTAAMLGLFYDTSLRSSELARLDFADVNLINGAIRVLGKGRKERIVFAGVAALRRLRNYLRIRPQALGAAEQLMFVSASGRPMGNSDIGQVFARLAARSGIVRLHPHLLRRTFALTFRRNDGDVLTLQRLMGHASLATTIDTSGSPHRRPRGGASPQQPSGQSLGRRNPCAVARYFGLSSLAPSSCNDPGNSPTDQNDALFSRVAALPGRPRSSPLS